MTAPAIHGKRPVFSASSVLGAVGAELSLIKAQDGLTWADVGRVLGRSEDQAAKYADGTAEMGIVAFASAKREWNGRFTGALDRLCHDSRPAIDSDQSRHCKLLRAALSVAEALENDGQMDADEVRRRRRELEEASESIAELLGKLERVEARA